MSKLLFIGDSITQDNRFDDPRGLGHGYVSLIYDYITLQLPEKEINVINRGISGDEITHLEKRWDKDVLQNNPDYLSISIGINDAWGQVKRNEKNAEQVHFFKHAYDQLIKQTKQKTNAKIILMEPTIITPNKHSMGQEVLALYVNAVQDLSRKHNTLLVPLFQIFDSFNQSYPQHELTSDGIHMTKLGSILIAKTWLETVLENDFLS